MQEAKCQQVNPKNTYDSHIMHLEINDRKKYKRENEKCNAEKSFTFV
jgi:hypothetical protein